MSESKPGRGWRSWSLLEWLLFGSVWVVVGAHMFSMGVAAWPVWERALALGITALLALWVVGLLSRDRGQGYLLLTLLGGAGLFKPAISGRELWASFYQEWGGMAPVLLGIQLGGSLVTLVTGSLLYGRERARSAAAGEPGPPGPESQERKR
jgi:hypothetical protein